MKKLRWWSLIGMAGVAMVVAGCGGSNSSSDTASLRLVNATLTHQSLDLLVNSTKVLSAAAPDVASAYVAPASGSNTLQLNDASATTSLVTSLATLSAGSHYTVLAYESGGAVKTVVMTEDFSTPSTGTVQLRLYDAAPDAGKLDVYITDATTDLASVSSPTASFTSVSSLTSIGPLSYSPGTYRVRVTGYGSKTDLRLDIPAITLSNQQLASIVLTPASGGMLLNGSTLLQQGTYAATRNTNARVRLASAVSGGASVAASSGGVTIGSGVAPAFGFYALVPANSPLNITVDGLSVGAPAATLAAGSDATLLVYGASGSATATLIADDNRPPADSSTVKLRVINGIGGNIGALTLTVNSNLVGSAVAVGTASTYTSVPGSVNAMNLSLFSSQQSGTYYVNTSNVLSANTVYTVLAGGDAASPLLTQLLIR